jgi:stage IV sporulation protein FB
LLRTTQHEFPVVDADRRLVGLLTRDDLIRALRERGPEARLVEVMRTDIPVIRNRGNLDQALELMRERRLPAVGVSDAGGALIGLVTPENVGEMMMVQAARPTRGGGRPAARQSPSLP